MRAFCVYKCARLTLVGLLLVELVMLIVTCIMSFQEVDTNLEYGYISRTQSDWKKFLIILLVFTDFAVIFNGIIGATLEKVLLVGIFAAISLAGDLVLVGLNLFTDRQYVTPLDILFSSLITCVSVYLAVEMRRRQSPSCKQHCEMDPEAGPIPSASLPEDGTKSELRTSGIAHSISTSGTKSGKLIYDSVQID